MNENFTIDAFAEPVTALPTQPSLPPGELKRRLQAPAEEVRVAHNALAQSHERLDDRVSGIVSETFGDTIPKSMLSRELAAEIDAKAGQADNAAAHTSLQNEIQTLRTQKCEVYFGTYKGDGQNTQTISLGFTPKAVVVGTRGGFNSNYIYECGVQIAFPECPATLLRIIDNGFVVSDNRYGLNMLDSGYDPYRFIAFK